MDTNNLKEKWNSLKPDHITGFRSLRISGESVPDLYVGLDEKINRCLILKLPAAFRISIPPSVKENLSLELFPEKKLVVLKLLFSEYADLFDDLIISLYNRIKDTADPSVYTKEFVQSFMKWSEFFSDKVSERLSEESIKGLFGEVLVLNKLLQESDPEGINDVLAAWRGPFDATHDFIGQTEDLEVKTKEQTGMDVAISSEFQLQAGLGKTLQLVVVNIIKSAEGLSLRDLLTESRQLITVKYGNSALLLKAIFRKGLTFHNLHEYDAFRYTPVDAFFYNCDHPDFPKLIASALPQPVSKLTYSLRVSLLEDFITNRKTY